MGKSRITSAKTRQKTYSDTYIWLAIAAMLAAITVAAFSPVFHAGFLTKYDDAEYITSNQHVLAGLSPSNVGWAFTTRAASNWHPLTWISHMLDISVYGIEKPWGHHLTNLLLHLASVVLLFMLLTRMTGALWKSAFVAALFAIHPMHVESVAWVAERKDVLSTLFMMLTLVAYSAYAARPSIGRYLLLPVLFALGLLCKPMLVSLPFLLLLMDWWPLGRIAKVGAKKLVIEKTPLFVLALASSIVTYWAQHTSGAMGLTDTVPFAYRAANAVISYVEYVIKMVWPTRMATFYPHPGVDVSLPTAAGAGLLLVGATVVALIASRRRAYIGVGWLWYLVSLIPVIGLLQVGGQSMADRYTYVPYIGLFVIVAWGVPELLGTRGTSPTKKSPALAGSVLYLGSVAALVVIVLACVTFVQSTYWRSDVALFSHAVEVTSGNWFCYNDLGNALLDENRVDDAIANYQLALQFKPGYALANSNMGNALAMKQDCVDGLKYSLTAIRLDPNLPDAQNNAGTCLGQMGRSADALPYFDKAILLNPDMYKAHYNRGLALYNLRRGPEAITELRRAIELKADYSPAYLNLARALLSVGNQGEAESVLQDAQSRGIAVPPDLIQAATTGKQQ